MPVTDAADLRAQLVNGLIAAHDLAHGPAAGAVQQELARTLAGVGIRPLPVQIGDALDLHLHLVAGTEAAPDPALDRRVAGVVRPGWVQGDHVLRPAEVRVYTR